MRDFEWFAYIFGIWCGIIILFIALGVFGVYNPPDMKLCDDLAVITQLETRLDGNNCQILQEDKYWVDYQDYIELLKE